MRKAAVAVETKQDIEHVAGISGNDPEGSESWIAEAMDKVGKDGVITVEEAKGTETTVE